MADLDTVLSGVFIAAFSFVGINVCVYFFRKKFSRPSLKQSSSQEDLTNISVDDPQSS